MVHSESVSNETIYQNLPRVSIIVAAFNSEKTIERCLNALLALNYPDYEIIVVDNNSKDQTAEIVKEYVRKNNRITYLLETKIGWPAARNSAIRYAKTDFVANIDADCFATPQWLKNLMDGFASDDTGCVVGKTLVEPGKTLAQQYYSESNPFHIEHHIGVNPYVPWGGGNNMFLRKAFIQAGGYNDKEFTSGADGEFHARMERETGYRTVFQREALIYHEARGSVKEFFLVHVKYAFDGYRRSRMLPELRMGYRWYITIKLRDISLHLCGFCFRMIKHISGKETKLRVIAPIFTVVKYSGAICGNLKGKISVKPR